MSRGAKADLDTSELSLAKLVSLYCKDLVGTTGDYKENLWQR